MTWAVDASGTKTLTPAGTVTMTIASPCVVSMTNTAAAGDMVVFATTGALPTGVTAGTAYFIIASGLSGSQFEFSATSGGSAINTSGSQSGTQSAIIEHVIDSPTTNATYMMKADAATLALGDAMIANGYDKVDGTNLRKEWSATLSYTNSASRPSKPSPFMVIITGGQFTLSQIAGSTGRAIPWEVLRQ